MLPSPRHHLWILLVVALAVRILPATLHFVIGTDEGLFLTLGQNLAAGAAYTGNGRVIQADFPPGYPLFAAAVYALGGGLELPAKLNILLVGSLLPLPVYWLALGLASHNTQHATRNTLPYAPHSIAFLAGLLTALLPALALATMNFEATAEPLYSLFLYTGWAALWWGLSSVTVRRASGLRQLPFLLSGLALGAAHLVRWEGLILGLIGVGVVAAARLSELFLADRRPPTADRGDPSPVTAQRTVGAKGLLQRLIIPLGIFAASIAVFAVPYALFLREHTGAFVNPKTTITQLHSALIDASAADPYAFEKYYYDLEDVLADPVSLTRVPEELLAYRTPLPRRYLGNLLVEARLWLTTASLLTPLWIIPAILGVFALGRWRALFLALLFAPLGAIPASVVDPRYFIPTLPAAMIFTAFGWARLRDRLSSTAIGQTGQRLAQRLIPQRWNLSLGVWDFAFLLLFAAVTLAAPFALDRPVEYRQAGLELRGQLPPDAHMLARKRQPAFYADAVWEWLPFDDIDGVVDYAIAHRADYILLDRRTVGPLRPQLTRLLDPANAPANLRPIYYDAAGGVVVYFIER